MQGWKLKAVFHKSELTKHNASSRNKILNVNRPSNTKRVIVNVQPYCKAHFCWVRELASPAAEV